MLNLGWRLNRRDVLNWVTIGEVSVLARRDLL